MSFILADLLVESIVRDGLADITKNPNKLDDIFSCLNLPYNSRKYGNKEIQKIKDMITKEFIHVVHSFAEVQASLPCFSIQMGSDSEDRRLARFEDFNADVQETFTDQEDLDNLIVLNSFTVDSYDEITGQISVGDDVDLTNVRKNLIFVDSEGTEFTILSGVSNSTGAHFFFIEAGQEPEVTDPCQIKSSLNYSQYEENGVTSDVQLMIGVHCKNALTSKYLYLLLKYIILSRKTDLISRGFMVASYQGSDFTRNFEYQGDIVFNRFLTLTGKIEESWKGEEVIPADDVQVQVYVPQDVADAEHTDTVDMTIQPLEEEE